MTELKDLKVGDEVTVTLTGKVVDKEEGNDSFETYVNVCFSKSSDWVGINESDIRGGAAAIDRTPSPLPTEDGLYIPANNASNPESSWLYSLMTEFREDNEWLVYGSDAAVITGNEALLEVRRAHENLGGLVRLVPEQ